MTQDDKEFPTDNEYAVMGLSPPQSLIDRDSPSKKLSGKQHEKLKKSEDERIKYWNKLARKQGLL